MKQHLGQHGAQYIAITLLRSSGLYRLGNGASQAPGGSGEFLQNPPSNLSGVGRRRGYICPIGAHHLSAERFLLIRTLHHIHLTVKPQVSTCHGKGCSPLARSRLCSHTLKPLLFGIVGLGNGRVELMAAAGVISLELVINLCGSL